MAFGKKKVISEALNDYSICILGEPGIGKTTLMVNACHKEFGDDGYMIFNVGKEQGVDCIEDAVYEDIEDWKKFDTVVNDIIENKESDYPNLKVVVIDTLDQLVDITETEAIRKWNAENMNTGKDFKKSSSINAAWGGFGRGEDKVIELILDKFWQLQSVGVRVWTTAHTKNREVLDTLSGNSYTTLSTNMMQKYFNGIKTKMHIVGVACIDRTIETESTGRKNIATKKDITVNKVKAERRKIVFRDDNYSVDSKSRFSNIVNEIPLDTDAFIKALKDAIKASKKNDGGISHQKKVSKPVEVVEEELIDVDVEENLFDRETAIALFRNSFKGATREQKIAIKGILNDNGFQSFSTELPDEILIQLVKVFEEN